MAKLSIDIGVNLRDSLNNITALSWALEKLNDQTKNLSANFTNLKNIKINPKLIVEQNIIKPSVEIDPVKVENEWSKLQKQWSAAKRELFVKIDANVDAALAESERKWQEWLKRNSNQTLNIKPTVMTGGEAIQRATSNIGTGPVPDIFAQYRLGATSAATVSEFLSSKQEELKSRIASLQNIAKNTSSLQVYEAAQRKIAIAQSQLYDTGNSAYKSFAKIGNTANYANIALVNTGRVLQDLPFGMLGIANNITPLIESFVALRAEAIATGATMKTALLTSLAGPGGLILLVSALTAAMSIAAVGLTYWNREAKGTKQPLSDLQKEVKKSREEFESFKDNVFKDVGNEIVSVNKLIMVIKSETETRERKNAALKELKDINPQIFNQLNEEKLSISVLDAAYQTYISNIRNVIAAKILQKQIEDKTSQVLKLEGTGIEKTEKFLRGSAQATRDGAVANAKYIASLGGNANELLNFAKGLDKTGQTAQGRQQQINSLNQEIQDLYKQLQPLTKTFKIDIQDGKGAGGKSKTAQDAETLQGAFDKIYANIKRINENPLQPFNIKQEQIFATIDEGLKAIQQDKKLGVELNVDLKSPQSKFKSTVKDLQSIAGTAKIDLFTFKIGDDFNKLLEKLKTIGTTADILGTDRMQASINETTASVATLIENTRQFALENAIAFSPAQVNKYYEALALSSFQVNKILQLLGVLKEQKIDIDIDNLVKQYDKANRKIESGYESSIEKFNGKNSYSEIIQQQLKQSEGKLNNAFKALGDSIALRFRPFDPRNIKFLGDIIKFKSEINKAAKKLELTKLAEQLGNEVDSAFTNALTGLFEGIGNIIGGAGAKDTFNQLFANLTTALGKALIKFAVDAAKAKLVVEGLKKTLFSTPAGWIAIAAATAAGIALVASGKLLGNKGFAKGGYVSGDGTGTSDSIPARLSNGEYVMRASSVNQYGVGFMNAVNSGTFKKFANGGLVDSLGLPGIDLTPQKSRALVNRSSMNQMSTIVVGETIIRGQDLKLVLSRADRKYSNIT